MVGRFFLGAGLNVGKTRENQGGKNRSFPGFAHPSGKNTLAHRQCKILCSLCRLEASATHASLSRERALHACPHATVHWSPMGGGTRQYIYVLRAVVSQWVPFSSPAGPYS